uniref:Uncharacterized protein n=1 Tax=Knipowitschia caucasica TaxID=637954 RepID=A0AAV2MBJ9_KNICA
MGGGDGMEKTNGRELGQERSTRDLPQDDKCVAIKKQLLQEFQLVPATVSDIDIRAFTGFNQQRTFSTN